jgi:hypothetical protein
MSDQPRPTPDSVSAQHLKTWPKYFDAVKRGSKTFEIRKNDRPFLIGQKLVLQEYDPDDEKYTGREIERRISYMTDFEQKPGFVVLGLETESDVLAERIAELEDELSRLKEGARKIVTPEGMELTAYGGVSELRAESAKLREAITAHLEKFAWMDGPEGWLESVESLRQALAGKEEGS